jgi:hypothetical protein
MAKVSAFCHPKSSIVGYFAIILALFMTRKGFFWRQWC